MKFVQFPIVDMEIPKDMEAWAKLIDDIVSHIEQEKNETSKNVVAHCRS